MPPLLRSEISRRSDELMRLLSLVVAREHLPKVFPTVAWIAIRPWAGRRLATHRLVVVECGRQHAFAAGEPGQQLLELVHLRGRDVALQL